MIVNLKLKDAGTYKVRIVRSAYRDGTSALLAEDSRTGEPFATFTACMPGLPPGHACFKTSAENEGMLEQLEAAGIVQLTGHWVHSGYGNLPICRILLEETKELHQEVCDVAELLPDVLAAFGEDGNVLPDISVEDCGGSVFLLRSKDGESYWQHHVDGAHHSYLLSEMSSSSQQAIINWKSNNIQLTGLL